jgi:hypothetical protein
MDEARAHASWVRLSTACSLGENVGGNEERFIATTDLLRSKCRARALLIPIDDVGELADLCC